MAKKHNTHIFRAKTCAEAVKKAKAKLGRNFSIVNRREVRMENLFSKLTAGKLGGDVLEVELEVEVDDPAAAAVKKKSQEESPPPAPQPSVLLNKTYAKALEQAKMRPAALQSAQASVGETAAGIAGRLEGLQKAIDQANRDREELRDELRMIVSLQARGGVPRVDPGLLAEYRRLVDSDIDENLARELIESVQEETAAGGSPSPRDVLCREVARRIPAAGPILLREGRPTVVALVGPTGVGKSTTIAKLAVDFTVRKKKLVGLINEDSTRPGADSQMKNLGQLMGLPVKSVDDPARLAAAINAMSDRDLILIDTGGRSPRDAQGIAELAATIRAAKPDETHLVLSTGASEKAMFDIVDRFRKIGFDRLILTKLDEALTHGGILNVASRLADGLSYVTTGQKYLESLLSAESVLLARLILGMSEVTEGGVRETAHAGDNAV